MLSMLSGTILLIASQLSRHVLEFPWVTSVKSLCQQVGDRSLIMISAIYGPNCFGGRVPLSCCVVVPLFKERSGWCARIIEGSHFSGSLLLWVPSRAPC